MVFLFLLSVVCYLLFFFFVSFPIFCFFLVSSGGRLDLEASKAISALDNVSPYGYGLALCVCVCVDIEAATRALRWVAPRTTTAERERKISQQAIQYVNTALASNQQWDFLPNNLAPARELIYNSSCNGRSRYTSRDDLRSGH